MINLNDIDIDQYTKNEQEAILRFLNGEKYNVSTFIDEITITYGYGHLSDLGEFEFPLPYIFVSKKKED